jgi:Cytoplasmic Fragile-X interacting family
MLVDYGLESQEAGLLESILMPFDIYNDSAQHALSVLKQRFLYDEIEAEVWDLGFHLTHDMPPLYSSVSFFRIKLTDVISIVLYKAAKELSYPVFVISFKLS